MAKRKSEHEKAPAGLRGASIYADFALAQNTVAGTYSIEKGSEGTLLNLLSRIEDKVRRSIAQLDFEAGIPENFVNALASIDSIRRFCSFGGWHTVKIDGVNRMAPLPKGEGLPLNDAYDMFTVCIALGLLVGGVELTKCEGDAKHGKRNLDDLAKGREELAKGSIDKLYRGYKKILDAYDKLTIKSHNGRVKHLVANKVAGATTINDLYYDRKAYFENKPLRKPLTPAKKKAFEDYRKDFQK